MTKLRHTTQFSIPVSDKLIADLLEHFGPDPVTRGWCVEANTIGRAPYVVERLDEGQPDKGKNLKRYRLTKKVLRAGLSAMTAYPKRIGDVLDEDSHDAPLADLFVQFCIFGEEKYA